MVLVCHLVCHYAVRNGFYKWCTKSQAPQTPQTAVVFSSGDLMYLLLQHLQHHRGRIGGRMLDSFLEAVSCGIKAIMSSLGQRRNSRLQKET